MMLSNGIQKRLITGALALIMILSVLCSFMPVYASGEVVRVGYYESSGFQNGSSKEAVKSGYAYEYLQKIAYSSGWQYEYVYGSWQEIYAKFLRGEVDAVAGMTYSAERENEMLFPTEKMGTETYFIYKHDSDYTTYAGDVHTLDGKRIGTLRNSSITESLISWLVENDVDAELMYYDGFEERDRAFKMGLVDYMAGSGNIADKNQKLIPVFSIGESDYYLAINKNRSDLLKDLNIAQAEIMSEEPYFKQSLQYKYFNIGSAQISLTTDEQSWIANHTRLTIGYIDDYLPYCSKAEDGSPTGIMVDIINTWMEEMNLKRLITVKYVCYGTYDQMIQGLYNNEVNIIFPVVASTWHSEKSRIFESTPVISTPLALLCLGEYKTSTLNRIAVSGHSPMQRIAAEIYFPDSEIVEVGSASACLDAILNGVADSTIFNGYRAFYFLEQKPYRMLNEIQLNNSLSYCFGVNKTDNILLSLLDKGLNNIDEETLTSKLLEYTGFETDVDIVDFVQNHKAIAITVVGIIVSLIVLTCAIYTTGQKAQRIQMEKALVEKEAQIEIEKRLTEELRDAMEKAENANNAKTVFLFNMSHDIRTPMNAIIGFTELLEKNQEDAEKRGDYLKKIKDSSSILLSIINNVLEMARIEKGTLVLDETPWSTEQFVDMLYSIFEEMMAEKDIEFSRTIDVEHNYVYCDTLKLKEIYINILSNAYKYTEPNGKVSMEVTELPSDKDGYVTFKTVISDTGIGMSEDFLPHLFEEFSRENNSTKNTIEGTGLGMPIVKRLIDFLGGSVEVESEKGVGTTFTLIFSHRIAEKSEQIDQKDVVYNPESFKGKRILLAEDNDLNAEIATEILSEFGFKVERAEDGKVCVEMLEKADDYYYDLILMDVQMPNMNGYGATQEIRKMRSIPKSSIPILAMTANAFEEDKKQAFKIGMNGHLAKPIDIKELTKNLSLIFK